VVAGLIGLPCLAALVGYDLVAIFVLGRGQARLPAQDLLRGVLADVGLTAVYAATVTPRIAASGLLTPPLDRASRLALVMVGLGLAWYEVLCAFVTRWLPEPPDLAVSLVVLFVVPVLLAPRYYQWARGLAGR